MPASDDKFPDGRFLGLHDDTEASGAGAFHNPARPPDTPTGDLLADIEADAGVVIEAAVVEPVRTVVETASLAPLARLTVRIADALDRRARS